MTTAQQARLVAWRLKILQWGGDQPRSVAQTCRYFGISRPTFYKWKKRFEAHGGGRVRRPVPNTAPLAPRHQSGGGQQNLVSARALSLRRRAYRRLPEALPPRVHCAVVGAPRARQTRPGAAAGQSKAPAAQATLAARRETAARAPPATRREVSRAPPGTHKRLYQFTAIDDCTRIRVLKIYDACNQRTAMRFMDEVLRRLPFRIHVVQTDNGAEFQSQFHWHLEGRDIKHVYIKPRTPRLNGKVERSHRVDDQEFYQLLDRDGISDDIHLFNEKLREWEDNYNYRRPHGALDGQTPYERLLAKPTLECQRGPETLQCYLMV
jgi:transposase InsO family protein